MDKKGWVFRRDLVRFQVGCLGLVLVSVAAPLGVARMLNDRALAELSTDLGSVPSPEGTRTVRAYRAVSRTTDESPRLLLVAANLYRRASKPSAIAEWYRNRTVRNPVNGRQLPVHVWVPGAACPAGDPAEHLSEVDRALGWNLGAESRRPNCYVVFVEATEPAGLDMRGW